MKKQLKASKLLLIIALLLFQHAFTQDLNGDGELNSEDCQEFLNMLNSGTSIHQSFLDVNSDDTIDLKDVLLFGQWVNGLWNNPANNYTTLYSDDPKDTLAYNNYRKNVKTRKPMWTVSNLKNAYPDNTVKRNLNYDSADVEFTSEVGAFLTAPGYIDQVLKKGVAVDAGTYFPNFYTAFDFIHTNDLPVIFTTDAMLQTIYRSYDNILMQLETNSFISTLEHILFSSLTYLNKVYDNSDYVKDIRTYFETALTLLNPNRSGLSSNADVSAIIAQINAQEMNSLQLFGRTKVVDFSQFKPRGHYTRTTALSNYFKAMMWLSRADLAFEIGASSPEKDLSRMKKGALVTWDCVVHSGTLPEWLKFNRIIEYMVGTSDGLSIKGMGNLVHDIGIVDVPEFVAHFNEEKFDTAAAAGAYGIQTILSEYKEYTGLQEKLELSRIFSFMPQRFIIDSYSMSQIVYPLTTRILPSSLDIAFVLGDNTAIQDHSDLKPGVPGILGSLRQLYDEISPTGWQSNMYTSWINFLRQLNGIEKNKKVSPVFRTLAWAKKMRNAQLTSWAHLRHNTLLYSKQSFTGSITCSHPKAYVEPYPEFFKAITVYANKGKKLFKEHDNQIAGFFNDVATISTDLSRIAALTAQGKEPTQDQVAWLRNIVSSYDVDGDGYNPAYKIYDGWYFDLVFDNDPEHKKSGWITYSTIADVHTKPQDEMGPAQVFHAATGYINLMTTVVELDTCTSLFVGPIGSYYDVITSGDSPKRLNNEEWERELRMMKIGKTSLAKKPSWTDEYSFSE